MVTRVITEFGSLQCCTIVPVTSFKRSKLGDATRNRQRISINKSPVLAGFRLVGWSDKNAFSFYSCHWMSSNLNIQAFKHAGFTLLSSSETFTFQSFCIHLLPLNYTSTLLPCWGWYPNTLFNSKVKSSPKLSYIIYFRNVYLKEDFGAILQWNATLQT